MNNAMHNALSVRFALAASLLAAPLAAAAPLLARAPAASAPSMLQDARQDVRPTHHVRAAKATSVRNLPDGNGLTVADVREGEILAVYAQKGDWLSVEPPQGLTVWVFGQFLRTTEESGVVEVTGSDVRMRPKASSGTDSYALEQRLQQGDRLRVLGRADAAKPLDKDWVRVIAPMGVRGWVRAADTRALESGADAESAWKQAVERSHAEAQPVEVRDPKAVAEAAAQPGAARAAGTGGAGAVGGEQAWQQAEKAYEAAKAAGASDWAPIAEGYRGYLKSQPDGAHAAAARGRLEELEIRAEIERLRADIRLSESQRRASMSDAEKRLEDAALAHDPLWGRFQARGWLQADEKDPRRWRLIWSGQTVADVVCSSARYDLAAFRGHELGVIGVTRKSGSGLLRVDATRIEVLSARPGG
jgi:hypothetical protein